MPTTKLDPQELPNSGVTAGSYGDATNYPNLTVDVTGRVTSASIRAIKKRGSILVFPIGTPSATGADWQEVEVPYDPLDGTTSITWNVRRITLRVQGAGGAPSITLEVSNGGGAFSATTVGTVTLSTGASDGHITSGFTTATVTSGQFLRINVGTLGTATNWTICVELGE